MADAEKDAESLLGDAVELAVLMTQDCEAT